MGNKYDLKIVGDRLVIDLNSDTDESCYVYGFDGEFKKYDVGDIGPAKVIGIVELDQEQLKIIQVAGECDWCDEIVSELCGPHMFDPAVGKSMCKHCWDHDREVYKGSYGEDIGEFVKRK